MEAVHPLRDDERFVRESLRDASGAGLITVSANMVATSLLVGRTHDLVQLDEDWRSLVPEAELERVLTETLEGLLN